MPIAEGLEGRTALVTGASRGTGAAVAARLRAAGATVLGTARSRPDDWPDPELFASADLTTGEGRAAVVERTRRALGAPDVKLTPAHLAALAKAFPPGVAAGGRYPEEHLAHMDSEKRAS